MWNVAAAGGVVAAGALTFYQRERVWGPSDPATRVEQCHTIDDLVRCMQDLARRRPTEDLALHLAGALEERGVSEECVLRLSELHRAYGDDDGLRGYAITFAWGAIVEGIARGTVVIVCA